VNATGSGNKVGKVGIVGNVGLDRPTRVVIQQPTLAKYRVPVFANLAARRNVDLHLDYGSMDELPNVEPEGFGGTFVPIRKVKVAGRGVLMHPPIWDRTAADACDVLILTWNLHFANLVPALLRAKKNGVKIILWGHGYSKNEAGWRAWPRSKVGRMADATLLYNHATADKLVAGGYDRDRTFVALNAIDQTPVATSREEWTSQPEKLAAWQREHDLVRDDGMLRPLVLFVSRLEPANEVDVLLRAMAVLKQRPELADARVTVIGKGPNLEELRALGGSLGLGDSLHMPGPIYDEAALAPWFLTAAAAGGYCYPHNIGLSILHAFGYGCAVVTGDEIAGQNPEIEAHRNEENGLLFKRGDVDDLAAVLSRLLLDPSLRQRLSAEALRTASEQFTLDRMVDGFIMAIQKVTR
jgi:glycosyltransferase involved in cell wall biosynthesis